jgi:hypothetical protein
MNADQGKEQERRLAKSGALDVLCFEAFFETLFCNAFLVTQGPSGLLAR